MISFMKKVTYRIYLQGISYELLFDIVANDMDD